MFKLQYLYRQIIQLYSFSFVQKKNSIAKERLGSGYLHETYIHYNGAILCILYNATLIHIKLWFVLHFISNIHIQIIFST